MFTHHNNNCPCWPCHDPNHRTIHPGTPVWIGAPDQRRIGPCFPDRSVNWPYLTAGSF